MTAPVFGEVQVCRFCKGSGCNACEKGLTRGPQAVARHSDPETSKAAAASLSPERLRESQHQVLLTLRMYGPQTDETIYQNLIVGMSQSGARTRRAELVGKGLVRDSGRRERLASGRMATVWEAA